MKRKRSKKEHRKRRMNLAVVARGLLFTQVRKRILKTVDRNGTGPRLRKPESLVSEDGGGRGYAKGKKKHLAIRVYL